MFVTGAIFDTLYSGKEIDLLVKFCVLYTVTFIGSIVFSFLGNLLTAKANNQIMYKINRDVLQKYIQYLYWMYDQRMLHL